MSRVIVGLGGLLSDPACCVMRDGDLVAAVEQAKVSQQDRTGDFPEEALQIALDTAGVTADEIDCVALAFPFAPHGEERRAQLNLRARFPRSTIEIVDHHRAHAASAFYASPYVNAAVLSVDRAGDYRSAVLYHGDHGQLWPVKELYFPDSLGDLFNRVTGLLGYQPKADEHKVQWLGASGKPEYRQVFERLLNAGADGWPHFDRAYFDADRLTQGGFSQKFFDECAIDQASPLPERQRADLACSLQTAVNDSVARMLGEGNNVCISGGLSLNSMLIRSLEERFANVFVQPAGGNAGTSLGAALWAWHHGENERQRVPFTTLCFGPSYGHVEIKQVLENCKLRFQFFASDKEVIDRAVTLLGEGRIIAWMQGRMEFGPRALGNRSILASPLDPYSTENLNVYIKHREKSRKFAASVPAELAAEYFDCGPNARFLATVSRVKQEHKKTFSAALLGDDLIRVHTVEREANPLYHRLLLAAGEKSGLPVLYNTSFNLFGHPLVGTPRDAVRSFYASGIDALFAGNFYIEK